jgi:excisionase family DNA binding protein
MTMATRAPRTSGLAETFPGRTHLCVSEVAKYLDVSEANVMALVISGALPAVSVHGHHLFNERTPRHTVRIPVPGIRDFLDRKEETAS